MYIEYNHIRCGKSLIELDEIHWRFRDGNQSVFWWNLRFVHLFQAFTFSRVPITRTFKGIKNRFELSGVRVIASSKKIAEIKVKNSFYCTVNILITFNCRNVQ